MALTLGELIGILEEMRDEHGDDAEVRLMTQESYPFENTLFGVTDNFELYMAGDSDDEDEDDLPEDTDPIVYLVEGRQLSYGNKNAWDIARTCS